MSSARSSVLAAATLVAGFALALWQSWNRWLDPIIDTGRDLYLATHLLRGVQLYRDMRYEYPPLAPYLLAMVTRVAGDSLAVFTAIGIVQGAAVTLLLYLITRRLAGTWAAWSSAALFVGCNLTGASTFGANFIYPYSHAATLGMTLILLFVAGVIFELPWLFIPAAVAAAWCKLEYSLVVAVMLVTFRLMRRVRTRDLLIVAAALVMTFAAACAFFGGTGWLRDDIFASSLTTGGIARRFFSVASGLAEWRSNAVDVVYGIVLAVVGCAVARTSRRVIACIILGVIGLLVPVTIFFRAWAVLQWAVLLYGLVRLRRNEASARTSWLIPLAVLSIAATVRIAFNVAPIWYGFALIVPTYVLVTDIFFRELPERGVFSREASLAWLFLFAGLAAHSLFNQREAFSAKVFPVQTARGTFYDWNEGRADTLNRVLDQLHEGTLAVMPEGISLNYFSGLETTLSFHTFTPVETADLSVEREILRELATRPPDHIILLDRDLSEYGRKAIGVDYDLNVGRSIQEHYAVESKWSAERFHLMLLRKR